MKENHATLKAPKRAFFIPALAASFVAPVSWMAWRIAEWRARSFERFFGSPLTYQLIFFGTFFAFVLILIVAPLCLWLFRTLRVPFSIQIGVGIAAATLIGAAAIHLDPGYPRPFNAVARLEGFLTGLSCGAVFWFIRSRILLRHSHQRLVALEPQA